VSLCQKESGARATGRAAEKEGRIRYADEKAGATRKDRAGLRVLRDQHSRL